MPKEWAETLTFQAILYEPRMTWSTSDPATLPATRLGIGVNTTSETCSNPALSESEEWMLISGSARRLVSLWSSETTSEYPGYILRRASALQRKGLLSRSMSSFGCTYAISSGEACFAEAAREKVSAREGGEDWLGARTLVYPFRIEAGWLMAIGARPNVYVFDVLLEYRCHARTSVGTI